MYQMRIQRRYLNRRYRARQRTVQANSKSAIRDFLSETIPTHPPTIQNALHLEKMANLWDAPLLVGWSITIIVVLYRYNNHKLTSKNASHSRLISHVIVLAPQHQKKQAEDVGCSVAEGEERHSRHIFVQMKDFGDFLVQAKVTGIRQMVLVMRL